MHRVISFFGDGSHGELGHRVGLNFMSLVLKLYNNFQKFMLTKNLTINSRSSQLL